MNRLLTLAFAGLLFASTAAPTLAKAGASINAPDNLSFGDSFMPTFVAPNGYEQKGNTYLYASLDCFQDGRHVLGGYFVNLDGLIPANAGPFTLGPNPGYWDSGAASCTLTLFTLDFGSGRTRNWAADTFEVAG